MNILSLLSRGNAATAITQISSNGVGKARGFYMFARKSFDKQVKDRKVKTSYMSIPFYS